MQARWFFSQFYKDDSINMLMPICYGYGGHFICPQLPTTDDGWALVLMLCDPHQVEAAKQDPRVLVLPLTFDPSPVSQQVIDAYQDKGATAGMSMGALLATLAESEPSYGYGL